MRALLLAGVVMCGAGGTAGAAPYTLSTGAADGQVTLGVDGFGAFGSAGNANATDARYNPVGSVAAAGTTFQSLLAVRVGGTGARTYLTSGNSGTGQAALANPTVTGTTTTGASSFTFGGLAFTLTQTVTSLFVNGIQNGSRLDQSYAIANNGNVPISFELVRYLDGDLLFDGSLTDGGGLINGTPRTLFETDSATGSSTATTFVGITATGGTQGSFEIASYAGLRSRIAQGTALSNTVQGDGLDTDTFIDAGNGYDVALALSNTFTLAVGRTATYDTQTLFGTGAPEVFVPPTPPTAVPEPASLALLGMGVAGIVAARRRRAA